jgi:hypothetical protein
MIFDALEAELGAKGDPPNSASLGALETKAAETVAVVTGCDPADLKKQMRRYHKENGLSAKSRWRADPHGRLEAPDPEEIGISTTESGGPL